MYKNPLNNGNLSEYNTLKKQWDYGAIIKKYEKILLKTEPTELQKYYQYLTYQQSILDEANYVAEKLKNEDIQKQKENFEFIEKLKNEREKLMKKQAENEVFIKKQREIELFNTPIIVPTPDITPTINTDIELKMKTEASNRIKANIKARETQRLFNIKKMQEEELATQASQAETENLIQDVERKKNGGRPKGSKNTPKRSPDL